MGSKLLKFPTDYPLKVVGRADETLRSRADAIIAKHAPDFDLSKATERRSANGNFLSISYMIHAQSREQVTALAAELSSCEAVLLVI
jgi:putative lipoic acid-binding regulatory protein